MPKNSLPILEPTNIADAATIEMTAWRVLVLRNVTTAVSGHGTDSPTRHTSGNAVDISMINNKAVSGSNRIDADKLFLFHDVEKELIYSF